MQIIRFPVAIFSCFILFAQLARAADLSIKPGDRVVRVQVTSELQLKQLEGLDLDVWSHDLHVGPIDVHVSESELAEVTRLGMPFEVLIPDLKALYDAERQRRLLRGAGPFDDYLPLADMVSFINGLAAARPDLCEVIDIGNSVQGRDIWVLHITGPNGPGVPPSGERAGVFYHGLQHCREWITGPVVLYLANYLVNNYDSDPCVKELVDRTDFYLAPCVNPDGYEYTWTTQRLWRKNRRLNGDGSFGVDLNRNWGYQWGFDNSGSSPTPSSDLYRGPFAFSEPETQALRDFVLAHPNIRAYMDYHSYSQLILWPWGYTSAVTPHQAVFDSVGQRMRELILAVHGQNYVAGPINTTIYPANGGSADWVYGGNANLILAYSIELRDTGTYGFVLPAEQIIPTCQENLPAILHLSRWASAGLLLEPDGEVPGSVQAGQPVKLLVTISPLQEAYVPGSGLCYYRFGASGAFGSIPLAPVSGNLYSATLPAPPCGSPVEYYFSAAGDGGHVVQSPCDAPAHVYETLAIESSVAYETTFEPSIGWTVGDVGDNATTGIWGAMDPQATAAQPGDDHTPGGGLICFVTDGRAGSSVGTYDVDGGKTTLKSPLLDLSDMDDPVIGYWRWYSNNQGAAPGADVFVVDISSNGGANWVNAETVGPSGTGTTGGWLYHEFRVLDYVSLSSQVRVRFVASDLGEGSIVEAALDDFSVRDMGCTCPTVPGDLDGDGFVTGLDIGGFVSVLMTAPYYHPCADIVGPRNLLIVDLDDLAALVDVLLAG